ncbi:XVIPCD domain-containing protein [Lysobacter sp. CA199]|uniref:XVIPCD domain-containing protein n=1 Tax=Lysobacter sp. CA199 TaxID=3455608 RepID=UPI003F8D3319
MYRQALGHLEGLSQTAHAQLSERARSAAGLTDAALIATPPLNRIDSVAAGLNGGLFAIQGNASDPTSLRAHFDPRTPARNATAPSSETTSVRAPAPETAASQNSVSVLRQMFEQPQEPSGPSGGGPRR